MASDISLGHMKMLNMIAEDRLMIIADYDLEFQENVMEEYFSDWVTIRRNGAVDILFKPGVTNQCLNCRHWPTCGVSTRTITCEGHDFYDSDKEVVEYLKKTLSVKKDGSKVYYFYEPKGWLLEQNLYIPEIVSVVKESIEKRKKRSREEEEY